MSTPGTEVLFIGLSYALLVVNLKNNIFCLDYFDHDVWRHQGSAYVFFLDEPNG